MSLETNNINDFVNDIDVADSKARVIKNLARMTIRWSHPRRKDHRDAQKLADLGDELESCLRRAIAPASPERPFRADLDG